MHPTLDLAADTPAASASVAARKAIHMRLARAAVRGLSRSLMYSLDRAASVPRSAELLRLLLRTRRVVLPRSEGRLRREIRTYSTHFLTSLARRSGGMQVPARTDFLVEGAEFTTVLNVGEYTQCCYALGVLDQHLLALIRAGGATFLDVGANVGIYSL